MQTKKTLMMSLGFFYLWPELNETTIMLIKFHSGSGVQKPGYFYIYIYIIKDIEECVARHMMNETLTNQYSFSF